MAWKGIVEINECSTRVAVKVGRSLPGDKTEMLVALGSVAVKTYSNAVPCDPDDNLLVVHKDVLQAIVDGCWDHGIRPSQHMDFQDVYDAQGKHLADMRELVATMSGAPLEGTTQKPPLQFVQFGRGEKPWPRLDQDTDSNVNHGEKP